MLKFYSVNYTLHQPGLRYDKIVAAIKKVSENRCIKPLDSFWILQSGLTMQQIYDAIRAAVGSNDALVVATFDVKVWIAQGLAPDHADWLLAASKLKAA